MYSLVKSRYDGMIEIEEIIFSCDSLKVLKGMQEELCKGGCFVDEDGREWYSEIIKN